MNMWAYNSVYVFSYTFLFIIGDIILLKLSKLHICLSRRNRCSLFSRASNQQDNFVSLI